MARRALFTRRYRPSGSRRTGHGEPLLLIHPFMLSHHSWRPVAERLPQYDVLAVSMPGHYGGPGVSLTARFDDLVDHLEAEMDRHGWDTAHVVGNSLGGWAALELGRRGRARSVTAIAPAGGYDSLTLRDAAMVASFLVAAAGRRPARLTNVLPLLPAVASLGLRAVAHDPRQIVPADARHVIRTALGATHPVRVLLACARSIPAPGIETIPVPVHLVFADKDVVIPPQRYAPYFTDRLPHAKVTTLQGVGHCPQVEVPGLVAEMVHDFVVASTAPVAATA
jgi:pimeloyl-ACP methyl ester carboxylesterase